MNKFKIIFRLFTFLVLVVSGSACAPHFQLPVASDFGVMEESFPYDFRAATPDGLVLAVRELHYSRQQGEMAFWVKAIINEVRLDRGYSLLEERPIKTKQGLEGTQLRFGMDREGEVNEYIVTVFAVERGKKMRLYVVEAGGREALVQAHREQIEWSISEFVGR